jgi:hypothetical protein
MPTVKKGETRQEYVSRAMHEMVHGEGLSVQHAVGKAEGMYDSHLKKKGEKK